MPSMGLFAGKRVFASSGVAKLLYLSYQGFTVPDGRQLLLPAMNQTSETANSYLTLYAAGSGGDVFYCQMPDGQWIAFDASIGLNWLTLSPDPGAAIAITFEASGGTLIWKTDVGKGLQQIYYSIEAFAPILTLNPSASGGTLFVPTVITPSLAELKQKGGRGANLAGVNLEGADLSGIDFTEADFSGARLEGATCRGTVFTAAKCPKVIWGSAVADDAVFDAADFSGADLNGAAWGTPASAKGIDLTGCQAIGAVLGSKGGSLQMAAAKLGQGVFIGADLRGTKLMGASLGSGNFEGCLFDGADLSDADLTRGFFLRASFKDKTVLTNVKAQAANFIGADLRGATLSRAQLGSRAFLFYLDATFAGTLNTNKFPQPDLIAAFAQNGITLAGSAPVLVIVKDKAWQIEDNTSGPFALNLNVQGSISVFRNVSLPAATLAGANCAGAVATSANLVGADLSGVRWNGSGSTLDHAELTGASFNDALLVALDLTQANLSGADFSNAIICQANMQKTVIDSAGAANPTRFGRAQLQGAQFGAATVLSAGFYRAGIALDLGVPLFFLPLSAKAELTPQKLENLSGDFDNAGFPFGTGATVRNVELWILDNAADPNPSSPPTYSVELNSGKYQVFDGADGRYLFELNPSLAPQLRKAEASTQLVSGFTAANHSLAVGAPISSASPWRITAGREPVFAGPVNYGYFTVTEGPEILTVLGSILLRLRDWTDYPGGVAFGGTSAFAAALASDVVGPAGMPYAYVTSGHVTLTEFLLLSTADG
ncbi:MAG: pentapeptide repeat-containing protein [Kiloniellaceae bacterium]